MNHILVEPEISASFEKIVKQFWPKNGNGVFSVKPQIVPLCPI